MSAPSKLYQSNTLTARVRSTLLRPTPRRRSSSMLDLKGTTRPVAPPQDLHPRLGCLPPSHREVRPAPSSDRARGLSSGGPHEGGVWAPLGGMLRITCPSGEQRARSAHHSGVHHPDHSGTARRKSHARRQPLTRRSSPSRRGCWAACLHRRPRAQQGRISGAFLAFACGPLRGPATQLRSHALRLAERGVSLSAQHAACPGGSGGQASRCPGRN